MDIRDWIPFLSGLACGIGFTALALEHEYDKRMKDELEVLRKNFETYEKEKKLAPVKAVCETGDDISNTGRESGLLSNEERVKIKENWAIENTEIFDYTKFYTQKNNDAFVVKEPEKTIDTVSDESQEKITEYSKEIRRSSMPPRILSKKEFDMIPKDEYASVRLYYYMYDDTLVEDIEEVDGTWRYRVVNDVEELIGDCLTKHGFDSNSEEKLYVINNTRKEVYTVTKKWATHSS